MKRFYLLHYYSHLDCKPLNIAPCKNSLLSPRSAEYGRNARIRPRQGDGEDEESKYIRGYVNRNRSFHAVHLSVFPRVLCISLLIKQTSVTDLCFE